jgi:hypothetical protein
MDNDRSKGFCPFEERFVAFGTFLLSKLAENLKANKKPA